MRTKLKLHEAIAVVLLSCNERTASIQFIANEINRRKLYERKDREPIPAYQIIMRTKLSKGQYAGWFKFIEPDKVVLK